MLRLSCLGGAGLLLARNDVADGEPIHTTGDVPIKYQSGIKPVLRLHAVFRCPRTYILIKS